ncbi:ABC transporter permease [Bacillus thuringiensis]|uniref:ABC transporter permease n=1 Tax=Bacillus thuringiensis TaxID=1428 RepID=A0A437SQL0_BACTU|nr:ABC transporter permease [Bacillus thuringiensis]MBG9540262.1 ABC transporter permease [Bacillus thuringiensis]MBG9579228.1 ABC transporter permease [Bacillus thuringiensis]RVU65552.1 ABC transporter permease [Bacillus thuringiensis]
MNPFFRYLFNCNRKKLAFFYCGFIAICSLLLFHMKSSLKIEDTLRLDMTLGIFLVLLWIASLFILFIALLYFNKSLKKSMLRYTAVSSQKIIYANLFFFTFWFLFLMIIGLIFLYYFSLSIDGGKTIGDLQQEYHMLYDYGIFYHVLSVFLWGIDFMSILVSCYFIIVITKLISIRSLMGEMILFIILISLFLKIKTSIMYVLSNLERYAVNIKNIDFIDENGFIDVSLYPSEGFTILNLCFTFLFIIVLTTITGNIMDKKLEI